MTFAEAMRILGALERHGVAYVLVGSMAMAAQGIVRATRDIDVFVSPDESNVDRLKAALKELFDDRKSIGSRQATLPGDYRRFSTRPRRPTTGSTFSRASGRPFGTRTSSLTSCDWKACRSEWRPRACCIG